MENFLKTKKGLEYLLETFPPEMSPVDAISKATDDYNRSLAEEQERIENYECQRNFERACQENRTF